MGDDPKRKPRGAAAFYSPEDIQMLIDLIPQVESLNQISAIMGRPDFRVRIRARPFIDLMEMAGTLPPCSCGKRRFHPGGCAMLSPDLEAELVRLLTECISLRQIAKIMGQHQTGLHHAAKPHIERMRAAGTLPPCSCGKPRFHRYSCSMRNHGPLGPRNPEEADAIIELILQGVSYIKIARQFKMDRSSARAYIRHLTPSQLELRQRLQRERVANGMAATAKRREAARRLKAALAVPVPVFRPRADALWSRINSLAPGWLEPHQRDDVVSEVYARVLAGEISEADLTKENVRRVASAETRGDIGKFGMRSLDAPLNSDSAATFADMIEDPQALDAFDRIFEEDFYD